MWKYIAKRLLLSVFILLGVSVIIYTLVRLMPTNYIDTKFDAQLKQGTVKPADVTRVKELYGLFIPDGRINLRFDKEAKDVFGKSKFTQGLDYENWYDRQQRLAKNDVDSSWFEGEYKNDMISLKLTKGSKYQVLEYFMVYRNAKQFEIYADEGGAYFITEDAGSKLFKVYLTELGDHELLLQDGYVYYLDGGQVKIGEEITDYGINVPAKRNEISGYDATFLYAMTELPNILSYGSYVYSDQNGVLVLIDDDGVQFATTKLTYGALNGLEKLGCIIQGYFTWLGNFIQGDLGESFLYSQPVADVIQKDMWISFSISIVALILQFVIAIPLGIISATHQYSAMDYTVTVLAMMGIALPSFFLGKLLIAVFAKGLGWFPVDGWSTPILPVDASGWTIFWDHAYHAILPITVLVILSIGGLMRYTRTNMLEVLNADYIRTARAKGLSENTVIYKHAFKNTMIPLVTILAGTLPGLFGGAMITEQVFSIPGIGNKAYKALNAGDVPFIMGYNMFLAVLAVIGVLTSDLMYMVVDPRVKISK